MNSQEKRALAEMNEKQLRALVLEMAKTTKGNAEWLEIKLKSLQGPTPEIEAYFKKKILQAINNLDMREAKKALHAFKKTRPNAKTLIDTMVYYVEVGVEFENRHGDLWESFYASLENVFKNAIQLLNENPTLIPEFQNRLKQIVKNCAQGWGHQDTLEDYLDDLQKVVT